VQPTRRQAIAIAIGGVLFAGGWFAGKLRRRARTVETPGDREDHGGREASGRGEHRGATDPDAREPPDQDPSEEHLSLLPSGTGTLEPRDKADLWEMVDELAKSWGIAPIDRAEFGAIVDAKTQAPPSYLAEYLAALNSAYRPAKLTSNPGAAVGAIWNAEPGKPEDRPKRRAKQFVLTEFLALHMGAGGFKPFGFDRFPGLMTANREYTLSAIQPRGRR
jgi:hypothetical protein